MAQVDGGYSSGNWGTPAAWGCSVYYPLISNAGWGLGAWGSYGWGIGNDGLVGASDTVAYSPSYQGNVSDTVTAVEAVSIPNQNISISVSETANISDTTSGNIAAPVLATVLETANVSEAISSNVTNLTISYVSETANIADTTSANATFVVTVEDTVNAYDEVSTLGIFVVNVDETSNATDLIFPNGVYAQRINESVNAQDIVSRRGLWEQIDTGTTETWVLINTY